jgi:hypothetical protein
MLASLLQSVLTITGTSEERNIMKNTKDGWMRLNFRVRDNRNESVMSFGHILKINKNSSENECIKSINDYFESFTYPATIWITNLAKDPSQPYLPFKDVYSVNNGN